MPLYSKNGRTIHHIHIPGCAGNSVANLLKDNNWSLVKLPIPQEFESFLGIKNSEKWTPVYTDHESKGIWKVTVQ